MDGWERFSETKLQHKKMFYSSLSDEHIMQTFGGLSLFVPQNRRLLLSGCFGELQKHLEQRGMEPDHY